MRLAALFAELKRQAERTGEDRFAQLTGGARICVRVRDGLTTLSIARRERPVGDVEIATFLAACCVPATATRWPTAGQHRREHQGTTFHQVVFRWCERASDDA